MLKKRSSLKSRTQISSMWQYLMRICRSLLKIKLKWVRHLLILGHL